MLPWDGEFRTEDRSPLTHPAFEFTIGVAVVVKELFDCRRWSLKTRESPWHAVECR
jgi:hypothetical protein